MIDTDAFDSVCCVFRKYGVSEIDAERIVEYASTVEKIGDSEHGFLLLLKIMRRLEENGYNVFKTSNIRIIKEMDTFSVFDAQNSIGILSASECMSYSIENAKRKGVYTVFCRNCNTFGSAFYYSRMAIESGCIGICMTNTPAVMNPFGGAEHLLGTNPISIGIPGNNDSFEFDMSSSVVSKSTIVEYSKNNKSMPEGWGVNKSGEPTTNPNDVLQGGSVLPVGGYKGYGIALAVDCLCGVLTGSGSLSNVKFFNNSDYSSMNVGQIFICINPKTVLGDSFFEEIDHNLEVLRMSKTVRETEKILVPGDRKKEKAKDKQLIKIPDELKDYLEHILIEE